MLRTNFPGRVNTRRKDALERRRSDVKKFKDILAEVRDEIEGGHGNLTKREHLDIVQGKIAIAQADIAALEKKIVNNL